MGMQAAHALVQWTTGTGRRKVGRNGARNQPDLLGLTTPYKYVKCATIILVMLSGMALSLVQKGTKTPGSSSFSVEQSAADQASHDVPESVARWLNRGTVARSS